VRVCDLYYCLLQLDELLYFGIVALVFLFAYGVAVQSLLYPNSHESWWHILYQVFSRPYLSVFEAFDLDELAGVYRVFVLRHRMSVYPRSGDYRGDGGDTSPQHFGWGDANVNVPPPLIAHLVILLTFV